MPKAIGIPDKKRFGDPQDLRVGSLYDYVVQKHLAKRRGKHYDVRVGDEKGLHSFATNELPKPGEKVFAIHQPLHEYAYKDFEGEIPAGYGAGSVSKEREGKVLVTRKDKGVIHGTTTDREQKRLALIGPHHGRIYSLVKTKPYDYEKVEKPQTKLIKPEHVRERLEKLHPGEVVQPKIDGSLMLLHLLKEYPELLSHRTSKRTGRPIVHTERILGERPKLKVPKHLQNSVAYGETYGETKNGKVLPAQETGGLLNANLDTSLERQKERGVTLKTMLFDMAKIPGQDRDKVPYDERRKLLDEVLKLMPQDKFHGPIDEARDPKSALKLLDSIAQGKHPKTQEGVVIHKQHGIPEKLKFRNEHNVYIRDIFEGEGKYKGKAAGGFWYSHSPKGPIVGKVGTGLTDEMRRMLWENRDSYLGLKAAVTAQERYGKTHALRAPSLISIDTTVQP